MGTTNQPDTIHSFKDIPIQPDPILEYSQSVRDQNTPIIIDNGCYNCRAGFANYDTPQLTFRNITAKQRGKKETDIQVGNEIPQIESLKWSLRSPFDRNIVTQYDVQEQILDYVFSHLGINTEGGVDHPIVMTEPPCSPNYCRQLMSELLFECYKVPHVAYGVDALFSLYHTHSQPEVANALVVSCGYQATHVLPVVNGQFDANRARRINIGGAHIDGFMQRLLQLKYPGHFAAISLLRAEELVHTYCHISSDYLSELEDWASMNYYEKHVSKMQLTFNQTVASQFTLDQQREKKQQQINRLKEINKKKRLEKLAADEGRLKKLVTVQEMLVEDDDRIFQKSLSGMGFNNSEELEGAINKLTSSIQRVRQKIYGTENGAEEPEVKKEPVYDLLDVPDYELNMDQLATKKRQKILKSAREGRDRAKALQKAQTQKDLEQQLVLEQKRLSDFASWLAEIRQMRQKIVEERAVRRQRKADMTKRRTYASQQRMKILTKLAEGEKRKKKPDTFGQKDTDWDVYKEINLDGGDSDSEAEDEKLEEVETMLKEHDPEFQKELDPLGGALSGFELAECYRLHVAVEKIRSPELLFQPTMIGAEQAGIAETIDFVLKKYTPRQQHDLVQYVYLTGGPASFPGFRERIEKELLAMRPFQSTFKVLVAAQPKLSSWLGAQKFVLSSHSLPIYSISRQDFMEKGGDYLKEHCASNIFIPTPTVVTKTSL